jgi:threonine dehydrogenase-like Zn-dependent dehydrogenase
VIEAMAAGMDITPMITKKVKLDEVPHNIEMLQTNRKEIKITCVDFA